MVIKMALDDRFSSAIRTPVVTAQIHVIVDPPQIAVALHHKRLIFIIPEAVLSLVAPACSRRLSELMAGHQGTGPWVYAGCSTGEKMEEKDLT